METQSILFKMLSISSLTNPGEIIPGKEHIVRVCQYGEFPNVSSKGQTVIQKVDPAIAAELVEDFNKRESTLSRFRGTHGLPVYVGHPDSATWVASKKDIDTKAYAWITKLEALEDGLYMFVKWSEEGLKIVKNAFYKYVSPNWVLKSIGGKIYKPVSLLSVGLTNSPAIEGDAIANEKPGVDLNLEDSFQVGSYIDSLENENSLLREALATERNNHIDSVATSAVLQGIVTFAERPSLVNELRSNFEDRSAQLMAQKPKVKTTPLNFDFGKRIQEVASRNELILAVNEYCEKNGMDPLDPNQREKAFGVLRCRRPELFNGAT